MKKIDDKLNELNINQGNFPDHLDDKVYNIIHSQDLNKKTYWFFRPKAIGLIFLLIIGIIISANIINHFSTYNELSFNSMHKNQELEIVSKASIDYMNKNIININYDFNEENLAIAPKNRVNFNYVKILRGYEYYDFNYFNNLKGQEKNTRYIITEFKLFKNLDDEPLSEGWMFISIYNDFKKVFVSPKSSEINNKLEFKSNTTIMDGFIYENTLKPNQHIVLYDLDSDNVKLHFINENDLTIDNKILFNHKIKKEEIINAN